MSNTLFIIDPQNDFCDPENGALYVPGAENDMARLSDFIATNGPQLDRIVVSLDSHQRLDISHPLWYRDEQGNRPAPFTVITAADVENGVWRTRRDADHQRTLDYLHQLKAGDRYPHVIWPEHCLVGHWGHNVWPALHFALAHWEQENLRRVEYVYKGTNPYTEHFSAIQAEVPDPNDAATLPQSELVEQLAQAHTILVAGEARSHCVANTVRDLDALKSEVSKKLVLLSDTTSDVGGFEALGEAFVADLMGKGMRCVTTQDWTP